MGKRTSYCVECKKETDLDDPNDHPCRCSIRPQRMVRLFATLMDPSVERTVVVYFDGNLMEILVEVMCVGSPDSSLVQPDRIAENAAKLGATGVILAHNHPGGPAEASDLDRTCHVQVREYLAGKGITVLGDIIVSEDGWCAVTDDA